VIKQSIKNRVKLALTLLALTMLIFLYNFDAHALYFLLLLVLLIGIFYQTHKVLNQKSRALSLLKDSNKVKAAFLSNMSHEVRTPLNAINGYSEILAQTTNAAEKTYLIESIRRNSHELTAYIDNILEISKIEFGRIYINRSNVTLVSIIEKIIENMQARARSKGLIFTIESLGQLPTEVYVDKTRVIQILINLIGNAIKFTEKGLVKVQVQAQAQAQADDSTREQTQLIFTIIDTGIGISAPNQLELFQSLTQLDESPTRRHGGMGLGLALSRRLAQQLDGDVTLLQSQLDQGSVFSLRIPCGVIPRTTWQENLFDPVIKFPVQLNLPTAADLQKKKILIVEDSKDNQIIFEHFLKAAGAMTDIAENGVIALQKAHKLDYDLILMDIQLPEMDGHEATRRLRLMGYNKPIIALTAHGSVEAKKKCLDAGCTNLITKPVSQESLVQSILTVLASVEQIS